MRKWREYLLGNLAEVQTGPFGSQLHAHDYISNGIPVIMPTNIVDNKISDEGIARIRQIDALRLKKHIVKIGEIVFSRRGEIDRKALINKQNIGWLCGTGCLKVSPNQTLVNSNFLYYQLSTDEVKVWLYNHAVGATMPNLNTQILSNLPVFIPEKETQFRIASILSSLDDKIELNRRMNQTLEHMARALFNHYFVDNIDPDNLPEGWTYDKVSNIFKINIGRTPPRVQREWFTKNIEDVRWISIKDMSNCGVYIFETSEFLRAEAVKRFNVPIIPENTVILSFKLTVGRVAITTEEMLSNEAIAHFNQMKSNFLTSYYTYLFLKQFDYNSLGNTSSIATAVNSQTIKDINILVPNENSILKFSKKVEPLFLKIKTNSREIHSLINIRNTLLPKLMSGEIDVDALMKEETLLQEEPN